MNNKLLPILLVCCIILVFSLNGIVAQPTEKIPVIIMFTDKQDVDLITQSGGDIKTVYHIRPALAALLPQKAIDNLRRNPNVEYIVEDLQIFTLAESYDWGVNRIDADVVHGYNKGAGVNVAILDTGIDYNHPDLAANYAGGYDWVNSDSDPMDDHGHGTHCAGIVAAVMGNEQGVIGVAPEAKLWALKVLGAGGSGSYSYVLSALEWCIDTRLDTNPDNDIHVISMSLGSKYSSGDPGIESWINAAYDAGIVLVGAAGNSGTIPGNQDDVEYPARYANVIAVAATDSSNTRVAIGGWWSSCTGPAVELAAPGLYIYSTYWDDTYRTLSGTSMACPMVSGTAALVIASGIADGNANGRINDEVRTRLQVTADDLGDPGRDTWYGFGLVDANGAAPAAPREVISCDLNGTSRDSFAPGEGVYVKAYGLEGSESYLIWIQNESVVEGDDLISGEDPSSSQEPVLTEPDGSLPETLIWQIPPDAPITNSPYDIMLDKQDDGLNTGKYNSASDGIDSATVAGFAAPVPELPTIFLFCAGLLTLTGYVLWKKRI